MRLGNLELGRHRLEVAVGYDLLVAQLLLAGVIELGAIALGLGAAEGGGGGGDLLRARARLQLREGGFGGGEFGAADRDLLLLLGIVEPGDEPAGRDVLALGDGAFDDATRGLEAELGVIHLEVAGEGEVAGVAGAGAGGEEEQQGEGGGQTRQAGAAVRRGGVFHGLCDRRG